MFPFSSLLDESCTRFVMCCFHFHTYTHTHTHTHTQGTFQVAISENDNPRGTFSLSPSSLTLSEDTNPSGTLTITRDGGHFESVQIEWEALYTDGLDHLVDLSDILVTSRATLNFTAGQSSATISLQLRPNRVRWWEGEEDKR